MTPHEMVREFMTAFRQEVPDRQTMLTPETQAFRWDLIKEEATEFGFAENLTQLLDAIIDLQYVIEGAAITAGFTGETLRLAFAEVHRSNMSKLWTASEINSLPPDCTATFAATNERGACYIVKRSDGKVIKSPSYSPANLQQFIE